MGIRLMKNGLALKLVIILGIRLLMNKAHWGQESSWAKTIDVKAKPANAWGLYQMHGNIWEWCLDRYDENYYQSSPERDPRGPSDSSFEKRVLRGGSWDSYASNLRSANRIWDSPGFYWRSNSSFRLALG